MIYLATEKDYETSFTFRKPNHFWVQLNQQMNIKGRDELNTGGLYHLILFSSLPQDFNTCCNTNGTLKSTATGMTKITTGYTDQLFHLGVKWLDNGENGFSLFLDEWEDNTDPTSEKIDVDIPVSTEFYVKGVALCKHIDSSTEYVVAYASASTRIRCFNHISLMSGTSFVGHESCTGVGN